MAELQADLPSEPASGDDAGHGHRTRFVVLGLVVALSVGYMVYAAFPGNALYFLTVSEFMARDNAQDGRLVRVAGKLVDGSFLREEKSTLSSFRLTDKDGGLEGEQLAASYVGILPDLFFKPPFRGNPGRELRAGPGVSSRQCVGQVSFKISVAGARTESAELMPGPQGSDRQGAASCLDEFYPSTTV